MFDNFDTFVLVLTIWWSKTSDKPVISIL